METIRNYLETMFQNLPNTQEVQKAKYELGQMMEDKYTELKKEGKTENEAIGIVISEFGNLDDIADDLGISNYVNQKDFADNRMLSMQEGKEFIKEKQIAGFLIGIGTLLCIISPSGVILSDGSLAGLIFLFLSIAAAVALFIVSGAFMGKWDFMKQESCSIDFATAEYIHNERENYRMTGAIMIAVGVVFCIVSFVPLVILDELNGSDIADNLGVVILLTFVAIGVLLFIMAGTRKGAYDFLLKLNDVHSMGGRFVSSQASQVHYNNKTVAAVMSVYWPTVTCIYLIWSFLSFDWHITWIVWVIAGVIETFIKNMYQD